MNSEIQKHLNRADELLKVAELLVSKHPPDSVGRSYYAMLHAARAVLLSLGIERKSHHAVWAAFGEHVSNLGLLPVELHRSALDAFQARALSDYLSQPSDDKKDAESYLESARDFVAECRRYLAENDT